MVTMTPPRPQAPPPHDLAAADWSDRALRRTWQTVGTVSVAIGVVNAFISLLPATVFLLIGLWAYGKAAPQVRERLQAPRWGQALRLWREQRQIQRRGKVAAVLALAASAVATVWVLGARPLSWVMLSGSAALGWYLVTRPEPDRADALG